MWWEEGGEQRKEREKAFKISFEILYISLKM